MAKSEKKDANGVEFGDDTHPNSKDPETTSKAVALVDEKQGDKIPRVVASGRGAFAEQILQIAWANGIKVREDADLVEILTAIEVDTEIPIEVFAAVAEILSYVYRANAGLIPLEKDENQTYDHLNR